VTNVTEQRKLLSAIGFPNSNLPQCIVWFQESWTRSDLAIDGIWGPKTDAAVRKCVSDGGLISDHFLLAEFACPHCRWPRANRELVRGLEKLRANSYPKGLAVVSGYRCIKHNTDIGGAPGSQHLKGRAADIPPVISVHDVAALELFGGLEFQPAHSGMLCTHVDVRAGGDVKHPNIFAW
jgi:hypothetical protein